MDPNKLTEREQAILRYVIHQYILTASPVGSRNIAKKYDVGCSPATIRNVMADLEDSGYLNHPHTSAGRTPTDKGYRFYVDALMEMRKLSQEAMSFIDNELDTSFSDTDEILRITSLVLSNLTKQVACITYPQFDNATLEKIQIVNISSTKIMVVLTVKFGMIKTITLEIDSEISGEKTQTVERLLNERLSGLAFKEIKNSIHDRIKDRIDENLKPIVRVFLESKDIIFEDTKMSEKSIITGTKNILQHPEFENHDEFQSIIELVEDKDVIIHIMNEKSSIQKGDFIISIGSENKDEKLNKFSLVTKNYNIGETAGTLGIVGPKRMEYSNAVAAVVYMAEMLSKELVK